MQHFLDFLKPHFADSEAGKEGGSGEHAQEEQSDAEVETTEPGQGGGQTGGGPEDENGDESGGN